jgi:AraC-like DNA-binding protein
MTDEPRGILRPRAIGQSFTLERPPPPADLADAVANHWLVGWDLRGRPPYRSEVLTHPAVHVVFEPHGCFVYGVRRELDVRVLSGTGFAIGTKFLPGGFSAFTDRPIDELTDRSLPLVEVFGEGARELGEVGSGFEGPDEVLEPLVELLREHRREPDAGAELVNAAVADMLHAEPGLTVSDIAARQAVSARTLQRLFARHVGVGPKWVLRRYRLHEALEEMAGAERPDWTRMALDLGYFDHAHFIRDFRAVAGRTPTQYQRELQAATARAASAA